MTGGYGLSHRPLPPLATLRPFEAAARHESFTLAAGELGLTQAAVSKQIRLLEADLGTRLFERRNRGVFLTEAGRRFGRTVSSAFGDVAADAARLRGTSRAGEVVLFCQLCEAFYWLMPRLSGFHARHPDIALRLQSSVRPLTETSEPFDVAIQTTGRAAGAHPLAFAARDTVFPVCAPNLLGEATPPLPLAALGRYPLLSHRVVPQDWLDWEDFFALAGSPRPSAAGMRTFDSYPIVLQAALGGHGVALGWARTVEQLLESGALIRPCREAVERPQELGVYLDPASSKRPETRALVDWLHDRLGD
ncbi:LysR substrate-binding domain-containing protein [Jiella pacifica]|uniref:LysR family transcriptional regulator n=1 Tax=Jiella pacifica TaxID=2696469 RepID=A0A6N9T9I3_9HYPH|nr:LysR substrate-binding domain-containing protein [Jiella pacifica]NDW05568.1 LysR family transcriptional regulator [Jiella pacifica]